MPEKKIDLRLFDPVFEAIGALLQKQGGAIVAIEGPSSSGKTLLARLIEKRYDCNVFHMDDFFLQDHHRTAKRLNEAGGNIDYERFLHEVVSNIKRKREFSYQLFNCKLNELTDFVNVIPKELNIIEGVYSTHPLWNDMLDLKVFLTVDKAMQQQRILSRNGANMLQRFNNEWIPLEEKFFNAFSTKLNSDIVINTSKKFLL